MLITLSESRFSARIRELENIPQSTSDEEINHRLDQHAARLFQHLATYGFTGFDRVAVQGTLGTFRATLAACHSDESRNLRLEGLRLLDPVSVTLEAQDLPAFYTRGLILTLMSDSFDSYRQEFQRLTVNELDRKLVSTAERVFSTPQAQPFAIETADDVAALNEYHNEQFEWFCRNSGLKVPGAERRAREAAEQAEIERIKAAQGRALDEFRRGPQD